MKTVDEELIQEFVRSFSPKNVEYSNSTDLQLFKLHYGVSGLNMSDFRMDYKNSEMRYQAESPNILMRFKDFSKPSVLNF